MVDLVHLSLPDRDVSFAKPTAIWNVPSLGIQSLSRPVGGKNPDRDADDIGDVRYAVFGRFHQAVAQAASLVWVEYLQQMDDRDAALSELWISRNPAYGYKTSDLVSILPRKVVPPPL